MIRFKGFINGQGGAGEDFPEEKERAGLRVNQHIVLADPAEACSLRQCAFQHRSAVYKSPVIVSANGLINLRCQLCKTLTDQFMVIPTQRITRDISTLPVSKRFFRTVW